MNDLEIKKHMLRFYKLANGLMSLTYIGFFAWVLAQIFNML